MGDEHRTNGATNGEAGDADEDVFLEFEDEHDDAARARRPRPIRRVVWRLLPVLLLTALLTAVAEPTDVALLFHHSSPLLEPVMVVCDVPWALIRVDGGGATTRCTQSAADALPVARLSVTVGQHTLLATAVGFTPYPIYIVTHPETTGLYLTQFTLTAAGAAQALAAVNAYFASAYAQDAVLPAALWRTLGLRAPPTGPTLLAQERFEAIALDSYEPFYSETTYQRPIMPDEGTVGIAAVVVEHVTIYDGCSATTLLDRRNPVLYTTRASVTFSASPGQGRWHVTRPYLLNPTADIYTAPDVAATPATPAGLMELVARATLSAQLGSRSLLADAITAAPVVNTATWAAGVALTLLAGGRQTPQAASAARRDATWLYSAGALLALTTTAQTLTPGLPGATTLSLAALRAGLTSQPSRVCGGG